MEKAAAETAHREQQIDAAAQIASLDANLKMKETLVGQMLAKEAQMKDMKKQYETSLKQMEGQVNKLQSEKASLESKQKKTGGTVPTR